MPDVNVITKYVLWQRAGRRRHGGTATVPVPDDMLTNGNVRILFWSVVGAAGGPSVSFTQAIPSFSVGDKDICATAFCVSNNGPDGIPNECYIDAFDIETGMFLDNDFVSVCDNKNGDKNQALSLQANEYGTVPTSSDYFVYADLQLPEGPFQYWKVLSNTMSQNGNELDTTPASKGSIAFAFYQKASVSIPVKNFDLMQIILGHASGGRILVLGPKGPEIIDPRGPDPAPEMRQIFAAAQQLALSTQVSPALRVEARDLAAKQLAIASKAVRKSARIRETKTKK